MFALFKFDLPRAITEQLLEAIDGLKPGSLTEKSLQALEVFQKDEKIRHGVYVLFYSGDVMYVGKAKNLFERLKQHWDKVRSRRNLNLAEVSFKCLLLDKNWQPSANENMLIAHFKKKGQCQWNLNGFGPKDPGQRRDGAKPSGFDLAYPINEDWKLDGLKNEYSAGELLATMKGQLPFLLRYDLKHPALSTTHVDISGIPHTAKSLAVQVAKSLGSDWQLLLFKSHMTLYPNKRNFQFSEQLFP